MYYGYVYAYEDHEERYEIGLNKTTETYDKAFPFKKKKQKK